VEEMERGCEMSTAEMFASVQYLVSPDGRPAAVQLSMETWKALLEWLEDAEDRAAVKAALPKLRQGPQRAGALRWEDVESEWDGSEAE
jgi:RecB family exonuclease